MIEFRGRVLLSGNGSGESVVVKKQICLFEAFKKNFKSKSKKLMLKLDLNKHKNIAGKVFILPNFKNTDATMLLTLAKKGKLPVCFLFSEKLEETAVSVFAVLKTFLKTPLSVIDNLGKDFLLSVENEDIISFKDNIVTINL